MGTYKSIDPSISGGVNQLVTYLTKLPPQRINRYKIVFTDVPITGTPVDFFATMVQIPSSSVRFFPDSVGPYTPTWKVPLKHEVDDRFIVEFMIDEKHQIREFFQNWMYKLGQNYLRTNKYGSAMYNTKEQNLVRDAKMTIYPLTTDLSDSASTISYVLEQVYPKLILPSEFNTDNPDTLRLQVDFNYRTFTFNGISNGSSTT
jgi:hypothetical protein